MATCQVCALPASVFCTQDNASLCASCDLSIHSANPLSARHERRPLCDLCHRSPAAVYCKEDAAHLCSGCEPVVHSANPIPHTLTAAAPLPCCSCQPHAVPNAPHNALGMDQVPADSHSACGEKGGAGLAEAVADITQHSSPKTSFGVVPEMLAVPSVDCTVAETAPQPAAGAKQQQQKSNTDPFLAKAPSLPKGFDFLELDNSASWLDRLDTGFDFADIFNTGPEPTDGLVPTLDNQGSDSAQRLLGDNFGQQVEQQGSVDQDLAVPSFSLSLPGELPVPELGHGLKRPAEESADAADVLMPSAKQQRAAVEQQQQSAAYTPLSAPMKQELQGLPQPSMIGPAPVMWHPMPPAPPPPAVPQPPQPPQPAPTTYHSHTSSSQYAAHQAALAAGGNLTREQRVARYREKRKNRKFEKTIRYASRKAYAEVRPRIKGRFATKEEVIALKAQKQQQEQQQQQQMFQQQLEEDFVVPNFV